MFDDKSAQEGKGREGNKEGKGMEVTGQSAVADGPEISGFEHFEKWIDAWNKLPNVRKVRDRTGSEAVKSWNNGWKNRELRELMTDPSPAYVAIRGQPWLFEQSWFVFPWLFKREPSGVQLNLVKVLNKQYVQHGSRAKQDNSAVGAGSGSREL